jgi:hypothetical protein
MSLYVSDVAEIARLLRGNRTAPLVLYCNGRHCGKSRRPSAELREAWYVDDRRYQLGIPFWRLRRPPDWPETTGRRDQMARRATTR